MTLILQLALAASFTSTGFVKIPPEVKLGAMSAVEVDKKGNVYVLHRGEPPLVKFDSKGKYLKGWGEGMFKVAHGLRADRAGNIWTTDNGNHVLRQFSPEGVLLLTVGEVNVGGGDDKHFRSPDDLVFSSKGEIYVADSGNGRIVHLDAKGKFLNQWGKKGKGPSEFTTAHGLAIDKQNRVYVADRGNNRVQVFDADGKFIAEWGGFGNPFGLHVRDNQLLVSEGDVNKIFHFSLDSGKIEEQWGDSKTLQLPHLMASDRRGNLYIAEVNGKRVQIFRRQ
jgi:DNA-binding beta-propeller fold protein YncE